MCGTTFWQMENSLLMSLTALLLLGVREGITSRNNLTTSSSLNSSTQSVTCPPASPTTQTPCPTPRNITHFVLARLMIVGRSQCEGQLVFKHQSQETPLCFESEISTFKNELCKEMRCGDIIEFKRTSYRKTGFLLKSDMTLNETNCSGMRIICKDPLGTELAVYKALTSILILLILGVILLHFSRPAYKTIRKRFSQKRQSRWIGPTQSQSVSYHRGQGPPNNNTVKRQSYPGLERLTVNTSREPSSNRNSDYDSYGLN